MKKFLSIMLVLIMSTVLCSCVPLDWDNYPTNQEGNTKWISEDEQIELYCENRSIYGYMYVNGEKLKIEVSIDVGGQFTISNLSDYIFPENYNDLSLEEKNSIVDEFYETVTEYESGQGSYRKNSFTVTFDQTTYLESGAKIKFNKVEWTDPPEDYFTVITE